jgi:hypothetical protein
MNHSTSSQSCPNCGGDMAYRVRRHGFVDWLLSFVGMRPFWCEECSAKFHTRPKPFGTPN